jgi:FkbM family methyltransferase
MLCERLTAALPDVRFVAVGEGGATRLPREIEDLRAPAADEDTERHWLGLLRGADLAIGVHGSNLLLPSGLAQATIELIPYDRYGNVFQSALVTQTDPLIALARHRTLYGNSTLSDVSGEQVAAVAISLLTGLERFEQLMTGPAAGESAGPVPIVTPGAGRKNPEVEPRLVERVRAAGSRGVARRLRRAGSERAEDVRRRAKARAARIRAKRVESFPVVLADRGGLLFELETRTEVETFLRHGGHFERIELDFCRDYLKPGMTAFDVGASIGAFTASFARTVGPAGSVHAFEPLADTHRRLSRTCELNGLENVVAISVALSDETGSSDLVLYGSGFESWSTLSGRRIDLEGGTLEPVEAINVATTTFDRYCADAKVGHIDLVKIDVEGAEQRVLLGGAAFLEASRVDLVLIEVSDQTLRAFDARAYEVIELLEERGFRTHVLEDGRLRPLRIAGEGKELVSVWALSPAARASLRERIG